jgi:2-aminobenzoate-CoA ligase
VKDIYPELPALPAEHLVPPERQPKYTVPPGLDLPSNVNIGRAILGAAPTDALALIGHERDARLTFGELDRASRSLAAVLKRHDLEPGERIAFRCGNRPEAVIAAVAIWRAGGIVVPTPPHARAAELRFLLADTGAALLVADADSPSFGEAADALAGTDARAGIAITGDPGLTGWSKWDGGPGADDAQVVDVETPGELPGIIWHTGGTTGTPKACYHTHRRYLLGGYTFARATDVYSGDRWLAAAPVGHALGFLCHTSYTLLHGATAVMVEAFANPAAVLEALARHRVSTGIAIAATWSRLLDALEERPELDDIASLRHGYAMWQSASSSAVYDRWLARGVELRNNFGSTAFANWVLVPRHTETDVPRASLGRATPGYDIRAIDMDGASLDPLPAGVVGRMAVRGPTGLTYWNRHPEQERDVVDGWTLVDDLIQFDDDGRAAYHGRTDFVISSAGYKIAPIEVEEVLASHPRVKEVGVVGTPDALRVEIVTAFVVLRDEAANDDLDALRKQLQDFVKGRIAPHKYPRRIEFINALPRDPVGKILPGVLKEWGAMERPGVGA